MLHWLGLTNEIQVKVYHGYGQEKRMVIHGHVLRLSPLPRSRYRKSFIHNTLALLRLFMVKPYAGACLQMEWEGRRYTATSDTDGFFKFEWKDEPPLPQGWQTLRVQMVDAAGACLAEGRGSVYIPYETQYGFISDIDDTFLISHSANLRKRLFVLFTENARSRRPFEGVVRHYQLLAAGNTTAEAPNPFFYVSSSEWNLYDYILEFAQLHRMPHGVFLLNQLKLMNQLLKTGQNNHHTKFARIVRILEGFPNQRFILLGDSSQRDPYIYASIVEHFPGRIHAVYIRDVYKKSRELVAEVLQKIEAAGVPCFFFQHSSEAILHSVKIGLIAPAALTEEKVGGREPKELGIG
ncbi:phosphatase domain-containing protein [Paraflavisolibacter sp. H34]|uniref:App1 family protein n=1 Tax=Huijunlia imazamoxiresistens TaxID=3127457 RepID=UPI00301B1CC6